MWYLKSAMILICAYFSIQCGGGGGSIAENNSGEDKVDSSQSVEANTEFFNFKTQINKNISLNLRDFLRVKLSRPDSIKLCKNVKVSLWNDEPENGGKLMQSSVSDNEGMVKFKACYPIHKDRLFLLIHKTGFENGIWINKDDSHSLVKYKINRSKAIRGKASNVSYLSTFNNLGVPDNIEGIDVIDAELLETVNASLPERVPLSTSNPSYLNQAEGINHAFKEEAEVWVTFVHEGAGYRNALGFFRFDTLSPPETVDEINHQIVFPNTSYLNSGGGLQSGHRVKLGTFQAGESIGWFLIANGWNGNGVNTDRPTYYSFQKFNPEYATDQTLSQHNVVLYDSSRELSLLSFEDLNRARPGCDNDFNDAIFYITVNPPEALEISDLPSTNVPEDSDGDGIMNAYEDYPFDADRAFDNFYPYYGGKGTLAYEDLWPSLGDYDFNDLVLHNSVRYVTNIRGEVVDIHSTMEFVAVGAGMHNGFAVQIPVPRSSVESVSFTTNIEGVNRLSNGTEDEQDKAVILVIDDVYKLFPYNSQGFINTLENSVQIEPVTSEFELTFAQPMDLSSVGFPPYNPFIFTNGNRSHEIHLPGKSFTNKFDADLLGKENDVSKPIENKTYVSKHNLPWALHIPEKWDHMKEKKSILGGYLRFSSWAGSNGLMHANWYNDAAHKRMDQLFGK